MGPLVLLLAWALFGVTTRAPATGAPATLDCLKHDDSTDGRGLKTDDTALSKERGKALTVKTDDHHDDTMTPTAPTTLLVEFRPSPVFGVDSPRPRFSWSLSAVARDVSSAAYHIVLHNRETASAVWDSGKVVSEASYNVECGVTLKSDSHYEWKVRWWASLNGSPSPFSAVALLHTGLFSTSDWHGAVPIGSVPVNTTSADQIEDGVCAK
eukprot:COSAG06_NODE_16755_length_982_cov_12.652322_1_plen_210_part_01